MKKTKLKWSEMNKKQRIVFVIDWILRGVLIAMCAILIGSFVFSCFGTASEASAFADDGIENSPTEDNSDFTVTTSGNVSTVPTQQFLYYEFPSGVTSSAYIAFRNEAVFGNSDVLLSDITFTLEYMCQKVFTSGTGSNFSLQLCDLNSNIVAYTSFPIGIYKSITKSLSDFTLFSGDTVLTSNEVSFYYWRIAWTSLTNINSNSWLQILSFNLNVTSNSETYSYGYKSYLSDIVSSDSIPAYDNGNSAGYEEGYTNGQNDGLDKAKYGVFLNATYNASITYEDDYVASAGNLTPKFSYTSVNFSTVWNSLPLEDSSGSPAESGTFTLNFSEPFLYNSSSPFYGVGNSLVMDMTLIDINGERYSGNFDYTKGGLYSVTGELPTVPIKSVEIYMGRVADLSNDFWLNSDNGNYIAGYDKGYNQGYADGYYPGKEEGYTNGYNQGKSDGYQLGFDASHAGGFNWLVSSVQTFLNTNFFGDFGIGTLLYVGLGISLCCLFIKFFAGG